MSIKVRIPVRGENNRADWSLFTERTEERYREIAAEQDWKEAELIATLALHVPEYVAEVRRAWQRRMTPAQRAMYVEEGTHAYRISSDECERLSCDRPAAFTLVVGDREEDLCENHCRAAQDALAKNGRDHRREVL